ncbi:heterokaryon incompatibility protein-domain-containing protein [Chaetomium fimeti]|uniref:Heterokaryon incompatibility protein-domain-containing protein n=1 Tax=Chaetomium fimeti TaxID=1854472 RepID=A0AAE0LW23_9PEZI|nr:heterokaryon incompatibility protein-domain-containing protein [Chaetomium fimeti]
MRLLNVSTREVEEFHGTDIPEYAILSHTWGTEEMTLHDMEAIARYRRSQQEPPVDMMPRNADTPDAMKLMLLSTMLMAFRGDRARANRGPPLPALTNGYESDDSDTRSQKGSVVPSVTLHPFEHKAGYAKVAYACGQAEKDGYRYVWVDTCCIDKRSSAEVSEAVNSMFGWYQRAAVCYAFLEDVHFDDYTEAYMTWKDHFTNSRWFTRGWTLQELLAPRKVVFYARGWRLLGTKSSLVKHVAKITGVDELTLLEPKLIQNASVAQRMSWAANRTTTKPEDLTYSLLGLFGVNMPIIYGEGDKAFLRLQEEIIKRSDDHTIFAWGTLGDSQAHAANYQTHPPDLDEIDYDDLAGTTGILAASPKDFAGMAHVVASPPAPHQQTTDYALTNKGLHITLDLTRTGSGYGTGTHLAVLHCHAEHDPTSRLALLLTETSTPNIFLRTRSRAPTTVSAPDRAAAKPRRVYVPNTAAPDTPRPGASSSARLADEVVFVRAPDLVAPGYDVLDVRGARAQWNGEFRSLRLGGVDYGAGKKEGGGLFQLAVVTFWNRHLKCGFVVRILVEGVSRAVFVDLLQGVRADGGAEGDGKGLVEAARRAWENPGTVEVSVPVRGEDRVAKRRIRVQVMTPGEQEGEERGRQGGASAWTYRAGHEVMVSGSVTFTEKWERDYQRTVNAKVERKKKGAIELNMSSMLWQAAPVMGGEDLDQPS